MKEVRSNIANLTRQAGKLFSRTEQTLDCDGAQQLMSPFIDSMASPSEVAKLELHLVTCEPCQRQLQSFISIRNFLGRGERPAPPEDLALDTRVRLSQERHKNYIERLENRLSNVLRPLALPAIGGVSLTMLFFGVVLGAMLSNTTVMAHDRISSAHDERALVALFKPVRTTSLTMKRFATSDPQNLDEPLTIETHVGDTGKVLDYRVINGTETPEIARWIREQLTLAEFKPATAFGKPIDSKIILSFVAVKS
jgi:hypothetical protein